MQKLVDYASLPDNEFIGRGRILRFPGDKVIHEAWIDVMVYECNKEGFGMGLLIVSGNKSGLTLQILPNESQGKAKVAIDTKWLLYNFSNWVYEETDIEKVYISDRPQPAGPPHA